MIFHGDNIIIQYVNVVPVASSAADAKAHGPQNVANRQSVHDLIDGGTSMKKEGVVLSEIRADGYE